MKSETGYWAVKVTLEDGSTAYLQHRNRTAWRRRSARSNARDYVKCFTGRKVELEPAEAYQTPR
jgi:hypothetical protein